MRSEQEIKEAIACIGRVACEVNPIEESRETWIKLIICCETLMWVLGSDKMTGAVINNTVKEMIQFMNKEKIDEVVDEFTKKLEAMEKV